MNEYGIEVGENESSSTCDCCGENSCVGRGFVYKNDDAHAVYYVGWSDSHFEKQVSIALAIGEWDDDSTKNDRTCFGLVVFEDEDQFLFRVVEPCESPWSDIDFLGPMLSREKSLTSPLLKEVFEIAENILHNHVALRDYLQISEV